MPSVSIIQTVSESQAGILVLAILILLLAALMGGKVASFFKIPKVAGEILGGLLVGPTILGRLSPEAYNYIFNGFTAEGQVLSVFYWLGLMTLMFTSGYESSLENYKGDERIIGWLIIGATVPSMILGYVVSDRFFVGYYIGAAENRVVFNLIFAIATAVTSLPVISKIFLDLGLITHRYAKIVLTSATIQDLFLWVILSVASGLLTMEEISAAKILMHVGTTLLMFFFALVIAPRLSEIRFLKNSPVFSYDSIYFILCFLCVYLGLLFSVNVMYSAFVAGLIFKSIKHPDAERAQSKIKDICLAFFTPVYFAIVGLRIHLTADFNVGLFFIVLAAMSFIELAGCLAAMRFIRLPWLTSFNLGVAMNARGGPGIVLASVTYEMGIINYEFFCVLIFITLITSAAAGFWIDYINRKGLLL